MSNNILALAGAVAGAGLIYGAIILRQNRTKAYLNELVVTGKYKNLDRNKFAAMVEHAIARFDKKVKGELNRDTTGASLKDAYATAIRNADIWTAETKASENFEEMIETYSGYFMMAAFRAWAQGGTITEVHC